MKRKIFLIALIISTPFTAMYAQVQYKLNTSKEQTVNIAGTSNVHDWKMTAVNPIGEAEFGALSGDNNVPKTLSGLSFSINSKSLKSGNNTMDNRTYKVIKSDAYPKISFKLSNALISPVSQNKFTVKATGALTIAGVTRTVVLNVKGEVKADQSITCTGTEKIQLTDYNIQPPSYMLGAMKVGNDIDVSFALNLQK